MSAPQVCTPWITPSELLCAGPQVDLGCDGSSDPVELLWTDEQIILAASNYLFAKTCYLYPGECVRTVWPCIRGCWSANYPCAPCVRADQIELPSHVGVISIDEVMIDGVVLDPSKYRLERGNILVRLDGVRFIINNFGIGVGIETTVTYTYGALPPLELQMAAAELACEMKKLLSGADDCSLPPHVKSLSQRGVSIELNDITKLLGLDRTGLPMVDYALSVHGNCNYTTFNDPAAGPTAWGAQ